MKNSAPWRLGGFALNSFAKHPACPGWARRRAAKALVPIESKAVIPVLFEALEDESFLVRQYAEEALKRMKVGEMVYFQS